MKTKLLLFTMLTACIGFGQSPITNYFSPPASQYAIVSGTVNHTAIGANATWSFGALTQTGTTTDTFAGPTAGELSSYPGTTQSLTISDGTTSSKLFYKVTGSTLSLTGASNPDFSIDYNTDNGLVGTYPLTFGTAATNDAIAGTLNALGQTPNYTGTIITEVDAYGALSFSVAGQGSYNGSVTRIKTEQAISFTIGGLFPGNGIITNYNYYKDTDGALVFRTTEGSISVPGLSVNETFGSKEALITNTLSIANTAFVNGNTTLYPNPVDTELNIVMHGKQTIHAVNIRDLNGRTVLTLTGTISRVNLSNLSSGMYMITLETEAGFVTKKIIKK